MNKRIYETYNKSDITKEILDSVRVGDKVRCNDWRAFFTVQAVSENYFYMTGKFFGQEEYSICEKKRVEYSRNNFTAGSFRIGPDNLIFGGDFDNEERMSRLESGEDELSVRNGTVNLDRLQIWRNKSEVEE